jgi:tetratricopeptide (TPR) repeat protein
MPGHSATWALHDLQPITSVRVVSYSEFVSDRPIATQVHVDAQRYQRELQAIGHLNDTTRTLMGVLENQNQPAQAAPPLPPDKWATYAYFNNLGVELSNKGRYKEAIDAFKQAIELNPNHPTPYLNLAIALFNRQDYTDAIDVFLEAVAKGLPAGKGQGAFPAVLRDCRQPRIGARCSEPLLRGDSGTRARAGNAAFFDYGPQQSGHLLREEGRLRTSP